MAFGQSFQITAIQLLTTASSIINGGNRITPHFGIEALNRDGEVEETFSYPVQTGIVSEETSATMRYILEMVVRKAPAETVRYRASASAARLQPARLCPEEADVTYLPLSASLLRMIPRSSPLLLSIIPRASTTGGRWQHRS